MHDNKCCSDFQSAVDEYLIRHRSVLDVLTKYQEASARVNRAVAKAVTGCGCVQVAAARQSAPETTTYSELKEHMSSHLVGEPCAQCREIIATEIGHSMFYLAALCNATGLSLHQVMQQEYKNVKTLGAFHLT
ncbi:DUF1573 domain-containing protein [Sporomusa sphaeroides]|uniref:DUF1573 domain-containing protein n=2 Tax=Sporomusa TaxID=2375 RepID=A0ABP2CBV3_9FIRM|nr:DUF1573 domain-containing protein [Sporomusa sphaeroides]OLS56888.1 hypothetical protein SPSPH_03840 [Sporomusa sphaeroides DSM 2875]CVK21720.1 hypothetical protein SSPH_04428 [Sporomusa sphaeroides DSM 2875]SCM81843.1 conserved hypothetical protein [uncultured Sporomusa sp.]